MPRPYPPAPLSPLVLQTFVLSRQDKAAISRLLGRNDLEPQQFEVIAHAIASLLTTRPGSKDTTVRNVIAALQEVVAKKGRAYSAAVARLADERSALDDTTHRRLQPLAIDAAAGKPGAQEALDLAAKVRIAELERHERVETGAEPLRLFCGIVRIIFNNFASDEKRLTPDVAWRNCVAFAKCLLGIAGIEHSFDAHPARLREYLGTDVPSQ